MLSQGGEKAINYSDGAVKEVDWVIRSDMLAGSSQRVASEQIRKDSDFLECLMMILESLIAGVQQSD